MIFGTCTYERELRQALKDGHWPAACAPELRNHVRHCASCQELALVTEAFQLTRNNPIEDATGSADTLWWQAQLRRRITATERVSQPVTVAQTFAWVVSLVVALVFTASQYNHGLRWVSWWSDVSLVRFTRLSALATTNLNWSFALLVPTLAALVLVGGLVVYLVSEKS